MTTKEAINTTLAAIGANGLSGISVNKTKLSEAIEELTGFDSAQAKSVTYELRRQHLIEVLPENDSIRIYPSISGAQRLLRHSVLHATIEIPTEWDGRWRMVTFDIPAGHDAARVQLNKKLRQLGLYPLQRSLWVFPYPIDAVLKIADHLGISQYFIYMEITSLDPRTTTKLIRTFKLD